jgi:GT2 family glycosyltransferase
LSPNDTYPQHVVTAVIVAHDGAAWLPHVIDALLEQTRPVQRVVAVDTGSRDRSGAVLAAKLGQSVVFGMDRTTGYGAAVAKALQHKAANANVPNRSSRDRDERVEWIWLLHDDCEPAPDSLEQLLRGAAETPKAAVLGPKVMDWSDRDVILEAGLTIDTVGRRITGIEPREVDQGQHDGDRDTLAVGSSGMLVRRDVWDLIHGFDTSMDLFREDIDFCWRVHSAGYRVRVVTDAVVYHAQAMARRRRAVSVGRRSRLLDRRNALLTLAGNLPAGPMLRSMVGNVAVSFLRALFFLVAKRVTAALDEMAAVASVLCHPLRLLRVRRMRARGRRAAYGRLRADLPPGRSFRRVAEFAAAMSGSAQQDTAGSHHATEDPTDDDFLLVDNGLVQRILTSPGVLLFLGLIIVTAVAERSLLGAGILGGGALLPATDGASGLWREYLQGFHPTGIGSPSAAPPYLAVVAILATVLIGKAWLAVDVILLGSVPIAGMTAFLALRRVTTSVPVRVWASATYALIPVATGAISAGRLGTAAAFTLIPLIGLLAGRMFSQPPRIARRAAWATGLALAFGTAFVPLLWPIALIAVIVAALALRTARPAVLRNLTIVAIVPPALLIPWTFQLATHPSALLLEAGAQQPGLASPQLPTRALMLLNPGGPGLPPFWVTAGLAVAALVALLASRRRVLVLAGWTVAVLGLLVAVLVGRVSIRPAAGGPAVAVWPGLALAIAAAGLLLAAAAGGDSLGRLLSGGRSGLRRVTSARGLGIVLLALTACSAPVLAAGFWLLHGVSGPIGPATGQIVPALVSVSTANGGQPRTLVLTPTGQRVSYLLLRGNGPSLGDGDLTTVPAAERALGTAVASLVAPAGGQAVDQGMVLSRFDIGFVLMRAPVNQDLARTLDGINGLRPVSMTPSFDLWRLESLPSRVSVVEPNGAVVPLPSGQVSVSGAAAPAAGGTLTVAEPAGGWHATLDGRQLQAVPSPAGSWAQAFRLPSGGGTLDIARSQLGHEVGVAVELLAALVVAALALPGVRAVAEPQAVSGSEPAAGGAADGTSADAAPADGTAAGGTGAPAAGRGAALPAGDGDRPGGRSRSRGRGLGRRGRRPGRDEPALPGSQRVRPAAGQGSRRAPDGTVSDVPESIGPVPVGAASAGTASVSTGAAGAGAGLAAGRPAGSRAAWPAGQAASRFVGGSARPVGRPDPTAAGRAAFDGRAVDDPAYGDPAFGDEASDDGASNRPVRGGAAYGAPVPGDTAYESGAYDSAVPGGSGYGGAAYDSAGYDGSGFGDRSFDGPVVQGPVVLGTAADRAASDRPTTARSPTGAWPYPDDSSLPAAPRGSFDPAEPSEPAQRPSDRMGSAGLPPSSRPYAPDPARAPADVGGGRSRGRPEARPTTPGGSWPGAGQAEAPYGASASWQEAVRPRRPQPEAVGQEPIRRDPGRPGQVRRDPGGQESRWQETQQRPSGGSGAPATSGGWPQQPQSQPSWPDSEPPSSRPPRQEPPSSWPANEQPSSWPAHEQPTSWSANEQAGSWPVPDQPRSAAEPPSQRPAEGGSAAWHGAAAGGPASADGQDWRQEGQQPGWAGDSLEPLPSAELHDGATPPDPDERSRRRWPAPEHDQRDERDAW